MGKRELIALLNLSCWCLVMVERLFLAVPWGGLQFLIVIFPDHTHLLFFLYNCCLYIVYMYQWQNQYALPLVPGWILVLPDPWRWQEKLLCSVGLHHHQSYLQYYMANLLLVQYVTRNAEVWTCQYGRDAIRSWQWPWYSSQTEQQCQLNVNIIIPIERRSCWPNTLL